MTRSGMLGGGRFVASGHGLLLILGSVGPMLAGAGCAPRGMASTDPADAAVTFRSGEVSTPASWQNLWGSWPLTRYDHPMSYDSDRKVMVIFGGRAASTGPYYDDTWEWDGARGAWNERTPAGMSPATRAGHVMVYDPVRKKTFLFSGWQPAAGFYIPDQWEWDGATATWTERTIAGTAPSARYGATMVWDPDRQRAVLFGGFDETTGRRNDLWEWDGTAGTWTDRTPAGTKPAARWGHTMAYDPVRKKMVVYSGNTGTGTASAGSYVEETWEWDGVAGSWSKIATGTNTVTYYYGYTRMAYDVSRSKMVLYYDYLDIWEYDPTPAAPLWTKVTTITKTDTSSNPATNGAATYDPTRATLVLFGNGRTLWEWNGADGSWTNRSTPVNGPIQRTSPAIAFDSMRGKLMLFGGYSSVDALYKQDTWQWSGTDATWTNVTNANAKPDGRYLSAMVYDSKRDQLLLWGGAGTGVTNDMWSWSPATKNWTKLAVTGTAPSNTSSHQMFYDVLRDRVELWINYYTIWEFDPGSNTWMNRLNTPTGIPTGFTQRGNYEITYDTDRSKMLFLNGYGYVAAVGNVYDADVWEWDAATNMFTERAPAAAATVPPGRYQHGVSYDTARRVVVMFAGYGTGTTIASGPLNDSWEWDGTSASWIETTPPGVKPLPRYNQLQVFDSAHATTLVFGGTVSADSTYGPQEIWEYLATNAPRPNGAGCSAASASGCASGNCVDGVCCAQTAAQCSGTCKACNVPGLLGTCSDVPAGSPDNSCASDQACDSTHACKARNGTLCSIYGDCASGHCADGVCCDTDCNGVCLVCNLASKRGTCSLVPSGSEDPGTCSSDPNQGRFCDASGVCTNQAKPAGQACTAGGQCASTFCVDGFCCSTACNQTCYTCGKSGAQGSCTAIALGLPDHSATTPCDGAMQYCTGSGTCGANKKANGADCSTNADCGSAFCVDSKCCNSACTGTCQSCAVAGSVGSCVNLPAGSQDTTSSPACGGSQYCDAAGTCQSGLKPNGAMCAAGTDCGSANCVDGVCCNSACTDVCYACRLPGTAGTCTPVSTGATDGTCASPNYCSVGHVCTTGKKPNGAVCTLDNECGSNFCVDGTCCETACGGDCSTCANSAGTCTLVSDGMDPRKKCTGTGVCTGTCNGQGSCRFGPVGAVCASAGCQSTTGLITNAGTCDGSGHCSAVQTQDCGGFRCYTDTQGAPQCGKDCSKDPECALDFYCQMTSDAGTGGSACPKVFDNGHACDRDTQCGSGTCSDGVCCNVNCDRCGSCNLPGSVGTCVPVAAGTDPNGDCIDSASDPSGKCGGMCDGHARCLFPAAGTGCGTCKACNGGGLCNITPEDDTTCGAIDCDSLDTACLDYHDLTSKRCSALGACKAANVAATCTDVTKLCQPDGGGTGGTGGGGTTGTDGSLDGGKTGGGGGGCGCDLGGSTPLAAFPSLLLIMGLVRARRRR